MGVELAYGRVIVTWFRQYWPGGHRDLFCSHALPHRSSVQLAGTTGVECESCTNVDREDLVKSWFSSKLHAYGIFGCCLCCRFLLRCGGGAVMTSLQQLGQL